MQYQGFFRDTLKFSIMKQIIILLTIYFVFSNSDIHMNTWARNKQSPYAQVFVEAPVVPLPGDSIRITVTFDRRMNKKYSPEATFSINDNVQQRFCKGKWSPDRKSWTFEKEVLRTVNRFGLLSVEGAKGDNDQVMTKFQESINEIAASYIDPSNRKVAIPSPIITPWDDLLCGVKSPDEWHEKSKELRTRFLKLIGDDAKPSKRPPLDITIHESVNVEGVYIRKLISYYVEKDERAWAYLTFPVDLKKGGLYPAIVVLHGTAVEGKDIVAGFMPRPVHRGQGHLDDLARRGYITIAPDHFNMGQRLPSDGNYHTDSLYRRHPDWSALGKIVYDASVAIDVLSTLEPVDTARIGVMGHSLGGMASIYLAAYDHRVAATACNDGSYPFRFNARIEQFVRPSGQFSYFPNLKPLIDQGKLPPIDIHEIAALIAPRPYLDIISLNDIYGPDKEGHKERVLMDLRLADVWELEKAAENFAFYVRSQGHSCQHDNDELMYAWLDKHLDQLRARLLRKVRK